MDHKYNKVLKAYEGMLSEESKPYQVKNPKKVIKMIDDAITAIGKVSSGAPMTQRDREGLFREMHRFLVDTKEKVEKASRR